MHLFTGAWTYSLKHAIPTGSGLTDVLIGMQTSHAVLTLNITLNLNVGSCKETSLYSYLERHAM